MRDQIRFFLDRIGERLWVKPLIICALSIVAAFVAKIADHVPLLRALPDITFDSLESLLTVISAGMLGVAVFAVGSMLAAYASASNSATPRSFPLVISDDVSQNALSAFIGSFIYSLVALVALKNDFYDQGGRFVLFVVTVFVFALVIIHFIRWIDSIARLGRLGTTIDKVEQITADALRQRLKSPTLGAKKLTGQAQGSPVYADSIGYVQRIDMSKLQALAEKHDLAIIIASLPGAFAAPDRPLAYMVAKGQEAPNPDSVAAAFAIGKDRIFTEDPRFGLVVLSEIASRALSPAVNDPGTAIDVIGSFIRLFALWVQGRKQLETPDVAFDRIAAPEIWENDMFDDAFNAIARDGAGTLEVALCLQKAFNTLASLGDAQMEQASRAHARLALRYAERALPLPEEIETLKAICSANEPGKNAC